MSTYNEVRRLAESLTPDEQMRLIEELAVLIRQRIKLYQEVPLSEASNSVDSDPLVGLFAGATDLATNSEDILQREITEKSGWTWKESHP